MSRFRHPPWLGPALPLMAIIRLGSALGYPVQTLHLVVRKMFMVEQVPRQLRGYTPTEHDVFITTFAKSGTNWAMQIAQQLVAGGEAEFEHVHDLVPWPEAPFPGIVPLSDTSFRERFPTGMRVIKTHLPAHLVPYSPRARYITVLRDPKEVLVSAYYFLVGMFGLLDKISFDDWYEQLVMGGSMSRAWARHAAGYWGWRERPNVLVLTYAEMKADLAGTVQRFAELIDAPSSEQVLARVVERAGFEHMKARESQFGPPQLPLRGPSPPPVMMRRGQAGASHELLGRERQAAIDRVCQAQLIELGSDLPYAELFDVVEA